MVAPTFKKATNTASDPSKARYGAPGIKYAFDVLGGTHATHRVQAANIEGPLPEPYYYVIYNVGTATTKARNTATGVLSTIQVIQMLPFVSNQQSITLSPQVAQTPISNGILQEING